MRELHSAQELHYGCLAETVAGLREGGIQTDSKAALGERMPW